jgi:hydroxymethylpyrimidine pyrophosphatase-like HAD family hydrolase
VAPEPEGPVCVFDLDWALETRGLGFPSITPAGAFGLHALARHGYRAAIATGRSAGEVRERCLAYGLAGGVAEYGAAFYDAHEDRVHDVLAPSDRECLDLLRTRLSELEGIHVDGLYTGAVRAYRLDESGRRRGLPAEQIASVIDKPGLASWVRVIPGAFQTDLMVDSVDKSVGLARLAHEMGLGPVDGEGHFFALAVGDSAEDLPAMRMAHTSVAPANADLMVRMAGIRVLDQTGPRGVAQAIAELIGHPPGGCATCRATHLSDRSRLLLGALSALDARGPGKVMHALRLAGAVARSL